MYLFQEKQSCYHPATANQKKIEIYTNNHYLRSYFCKVRVILTDLHPEVEALQTNRKKTTSLSACWPV